MIQLDGDVTLAARAVEESTQWREGTLEQKAWSMVADWLTIKPLADVHKAVLEVLIGELRSPNGTARALRVWGEIADVLKAWKAAQEAQEARGDE